MADKRAYFKLDVGYMTNPKVLSVIDESPAAILLHVASIGYAAQHLTDGIVPIKALLRMTGATQADADLLYACGLWITGPTGGKAEVHDYLEHQRSASDAKGASEKAKRAASARWDADSNASGNASSMPDAMPNAFVRAMPREEREEREETPLRTAAAERGTDDTPPGFDAFWDAYDKKRDRKRAVAKYRLALKRPSVTPELLLERATAYIAQQKRNGKHPDYTKDADTWLNGQNWEDELDQQPAAPPLPNVRDLREPPPNMTDDEIRDWYDEQRRRA